MERRSILVTGSPRSGTRYMGRVLSKAGLRVAHEHMADDGTSSSIFAADGPYFGSIHHNFHLGETRSNYEFDHLYHLVRDPLLVVGSIATSMDQPLFWEFQARHTGIAPDTEPFVRAMRFWLAWTDLVEAQHPTRRIRVEDVESSWEEIARELRIEKPRPVVASTVGKSQHRRDVTWDELKTHDAGLARAVADKAVEYGYEVTV